MQNFARSSPRVESDSTFCADKLQLERNNFLQHYACPEKISIERRCSHEYFRLVEVGFSKAIFRNMTTSVKKCKVTAISAILKVIEDLDRGTSHSRHTWL